MARIHVGAHSNVRVLTCDEEVVLVAHMDTPDAEIETSIRAWFDEGEERTRAGGLEPEVWDHFEIADDTWTVWVKREPEPEPDEDDFDPFDLDDEEEDWDDPDENIVNGAVIYARGEIKPWRLV